MFRAFAWAFACVGLVSAWTRLAVVESGSCEKAGCEVIATCPEKTWPVACRAISSRASDASNSWLKDGRCVASSIFDERITAKAACTSMFRSFVVTGDRDAHDARCPEGSSLERCFCQECMGQLAINSNGTCLAPEGRPQALCLSGDTQWLLQNAASIGFVEYCGWMPYQRPRNLPAESYRNDSDCRHVMAMDPVGFAGCSTEECTSLEDCIARCDVCANCSAVLQMASGTSPARCYMQENIHVDEIRSQGFETGFFVNERNGFGCNGRIEDRMARGITGVKLFADLECQKELKPEKLYMMDAVGLMPLDGTWVPKCSQSRCAPGGLSFVATFVKPSVVRCVAVQAPDSYGLGWRLSKTSAALTGIQSLTETVWQEVARSGKGMGVRATWDGLMEIEADLRSSLASEHQVPGGDVAVLPVVISLLFFFIFLSLIIWMRYFNTQRNAAENLRPAAAMVPAMEVALTLDEITFRDEVRAESTVSYMLPSEIPILQNLLDFTYRSTVTHERRCPQHCARAAPCPCVQVGGTPGLPVAFHALNALRFRASMTGYVKKRKEIQQRRDALKCLEMSSQLAVAKYPQLKEVLANLEPSSNEAYLWYGTNIRRAFDFLDLAAGEETAKLGLRFAESCTKADEHAMDDHGHYENVFALLLCRVCLGRFYYTTDSNWTREEVSGFDSVLLDRAGDGCRECVVYHPKQVMPEFLILYRRYYEGQDLSDLWGSVPTDLDTFKLEVPIYWQSLSRPLSEPFRSQPHVATSLQRILQSLVEASSSSRHLISSARQIEDSQLWLRYLGYRRARRSKRPVAIKGAIEAPSLDPWPNELLLWYPCGNPEESTSASEGSFQSSPRQRRAGIHLTETLTSPCSAVLLCRVTLGDVHYTDSAPDLAAVQSARSVGKDALVAHASRGRKDFVLFQEEQLYPEFLLELKNTE